MGNLRKIVATPRIYGHRGARGEMPENSMAGLVHTLKAGVCAVEIDVQNSSDGVTVVWHDHNLDPDMVRDPKGDWLTSDAALVVDTSYENLRAFDFGALREGSAQATEFPQQARIDDVRIVSLKDVCRWAQPLTNFTLNIEIKSYADRMDWGDSPTVLAQSVLTLIQRYDLTDRVIVSSFDWRVLSVMRDLAPDVTRGYLSYLDRPNPPMAPNVINGSPWLDGLRLCDHDNSLPQAIAEMGGSVWAPYFEDLTVKDLEHAHDLGLIVNVWTVNAAKDMQRMAGMGVDGIITDYPTLAKALMERLRPRVKAVPCD
ncbi:MAG: glycerophosphodiester phosphodiesterase family protein [Paracoccaceae bacterium]